MRHRLVRALLVSLLCAHVLSGCETTRDSSSLFASTPTPQSAAAEPETTGSISSGKKPRDAVAAVPAGDDMQLAKTYFREQKFSLAEKHFRKATETTPGNGQAWLGLAASHDELLQFKDADRAYARALKLLGPSAEVLNNQGYSFILRGDYRNAREKLTQARAKAPDNTYVQANLALLEERRVGGGSH